MLHQLRRCPRHHASMHCLCSWEIIKMHKVLSSTTPLLLPPPLLLHNNHITPFSSYLLCSTQSPVTECEQDTGNQVFQVNDPYSVRELHVLGTMAKPSFTWRSHPCTPLIKRWLNLLNSCTPLIQRWLNLLNSCPPLIQRWLNLLNSCPPLIQRWLNLLNPCSPPTQRRSMNIWIFLNPSTQLTQR